MLRNFITEEEYSAMENYRSNYAFIGSGVGEFYNQIPIKEVLHIWAKNKENLFNLFGKQLKVTKTIDYTRSSEETMQEMFKVNSRFSTWTCGRECRKGTTFTAAYQDWVLNNYSHVNNTECYYGLFSLINNTNYLVNNKFEGDSFSIELPNGKEYTITKGCKVLKALGKIASAFNIPGFEDFRICHSFVLNNNKIKGELSLSIHPLDYWTMSDNDCDWTSCMSWCETGSFRQGTIEMMNSPYVIVAYLEAKEPMKIGSNNLSWSNKKWRQLFIVDKDFLLGIKSYPYKNDCLTKEILSWLAELALKNQNWTYNNDFYYYKGNNVFNLNNQPVASSLYFTTKKMYNDMNCRDKHWMLLNLPIFSKYEYCNFQYSGESQCICCGTTKSNQLFSGEIALCCKDCDTVDYCCCCDAIISDTDEYYVFNGEYYCGNCYEENILFCDCCNSETLKEDIQMVNIVLAQKEKTLTLYSERIELCQECFVNLCKNIPIYNDNYVYLEDLQKNKNYNQLIPSMLIYHSPLEEEYAFLCYNNQVDYWIQTNKDSLN